MISTASQECWSPRTQILYPVDLYASEIDLWTFQFKWDTDSWIVVLGKGIRGVLVRDIHSLVSGGMIVIHLTPSLSGRGWHSGEG